MVVCTIGAYHHQSCEFEPRSDEMYSIQHYVIKFVSYLRQVCGFLWFADYERYDLASQHRSLPRHSFICLAVWLTVSTKLHPPYCYAHLLNIASSVSLFSSFSQQTSYISLLCSLAQHNFICLAVAIWQYLHLWKPFDQIPMLKNR